MHMYILKEKQITPDIVNLFARHELEAIGISNPADVMKLRNECVKYGTSAPQKLHGSGPPKFNIDRSLLEYLLDNDFQILDIAKLLRVSDRTVYRRMAEFDLSKHTFSQINDEEVDNLLGEIFRDFPLGSENMLRQMLIVQGIRIQRWRKTGRFHRRVYNVMGPNHLWHIDTNHKLVRWRFVVMGGIDGFSRMVIFLICSDNNTSKTVLDCFLSGVANIFIPLRVRSDQGLENVSVADFMLVEKGDGSMITGPSTHNQRIERL